MLNQNKAWEFEVQNVWRKEKTNKQNNNRKKNLDILPSQTAYTAGFET